MQNLNKAKPHKHKISNMKLQTSFDENPTQSTNLGDFPSHLSYSQTLKKLEQNTNKTMDNGNKHLFTNQLLSPQLTTEIDNYRDHLMEDDKKIILNVNSTHDPHKNAILFERKKNELLMRSKMVLQFDNEKLTQDLLHLEGESQGLKIENEYLKKSFFSHERKSLIELKKYQDRTLELMQNMNEMKQELMDMKQASQQSYERKEEEAYRQKQTTDNILPLLKSQEINIEFLQKNISSTLNPVNQNILNEIRNINKELIRLEVLLNNKSDFYY